MKKKLIGALIVSAFLFMTAHTLGASETPTALDSVKFIQNADGSITVPAESVEKLVKHIQAQDAYNTKLEWALYAAAEALEKMKGCRLASLEKKAL